MRNLSRNQLVFFVVLGVAIIVGALIILSGGGDDESNADATATAIAAAPTATSERQTRNDGDGDGIPDTDDACPAEGDAGFGVDGSGCPLPPPDSDGDGFTDDVDACPGQGDAGFGLDATGCPNPPPPSDSDGDGFTDDVDACPAEGDTGFGVDGSGCPNPPPDSDGDGFTDDVDACPGQGDAGFGVDGNGCPNPPPPDSDGDGFTDDVDACPAEGDQGYGVDSTGCPNPIPDTDGDGFTDDVDACPAEGDQGYGVDGNGCPNPIPDTDGDGFTDDVDACPAEGDAGFGVDDTGCPNSEPISDPNVVETTLNVTFDIVNNGAGNVTFTNTTSDSTNAQWTFGDGNTGSGDTVTHTYPHPGVDQSTSFDVTLTVQDQNGRSFSNTQSVTISDSDFPRLDSVAFTGSGNNLEVTVNADIQNSAGLTYTIAWDFGDGNGAGDVASATHTYAAAGTYTITLTVTDQYGRVYNASDSVTVSEGGEEVTASCAIDIQLSGDTLPVTATFSVANKVGISSVSWDFGGGDVVTQETFSRVYDTAGSYPVTLTCVPEAGGDNIVLSGSVEITAGPPVTEDALIASFTTSRASGSAPFTFTANNTSSTEMEGETLSFAWTLTNTTTGTQVTSIEASPTFTLEEEGIWEIVLVVTGDRAGNGEPRTTTARGSVEVTETLIEPIPDFSITVVDSGIPRVISLLDTSDQVNGGPIETWEFVVVNTADNSVIETFSGQGPHQVTLTEPGTYAITMTVTGYGGRTGGNKIRSYAFATGSTVTASFEVESITELPDNGGFRVCLNNTSQNAVTNTWYFDFVNAPGNGVEDNGNPVCTVYPTSGNYQIALVTVGANGESSAETKQWVSTATGQTPPIASFTTSTNSINVGGTVFVTNTSQGNVTTWLWELIDMDTNTVVATDETNYNTSFTISNSGRYLIRLTVRNGGGDSQAESTEITVNLPEAECSISGRRNVVPGETINYNGSVQNLGGRTITTQTWTVSGPNGQVASSEGSNFSFTWNVPTDSYTLTYTAQSEEGVLCETSVVINIAEPGFECSISGDFSLQPNESSTFRINHSDDVTRAYPNLQYEWIVEAPDGSQTFNTRQISFAWTAEGTYNISGRMFDPDSGNSAECSLETNSVVVEYGSLVCNTPNVSDTSPGIGETVNFNTNNRVSNVQGREYVIEWTLTRTDVNPDEVVATGTGTTWSYQFTIPGARYTLTYRAIVVGGDGSDDCTRSRNINVATEQFVCGNIRGDTTPESPTSNYTYRYNIETGGVSVNFNYEWVLNGPGGPINLGSSTSNSITVNASTWSALKTGEGYSISVTVTDLDNNGEVVCRGSRNVSIGRLYVSFDVTPREIRVGEQVCLNNTSSDRRDTLDLENDVEWSWNFDNGGDSVDSTAYQPGCVTYDTPGEYRIRLDGRVGSAGELRGSQTKSITVIDNARINVTADRTEAEGPVTINFTAEGVNITPGSYIWTFPDGSTNRSGSSTVSYFFGAVTEVTDYTVTVTGEGVDGRIEASVVVRIYPSGGALTANFVPSEYGVQAGTQVCFTDQSNSDGAPIVVWRWDFGNGETDSFTESTNPCVTFTEAGRSYLVTLEVENSIGTTARATNTIKTFSVFESGSTFVEQPQGGNYVCFVAQLDEGVFVTGWDFGGAGVQDPPGDDLSRVCYTYEQSGTYQVTMNISNGQITGSVPRLIQVGSGGSTQDPLLNLRTICEDNGDITLVIFNSGGPMPSADTVTATVNGQSVNLRNNSFQLGRNESATFTVRNPRGNVTFTTTAGQQSITSNCTIWDRSSVSVDGRCDQNGNPSFSVTNTGEPGGGDMQGPVEWRLYELLPGGVNGQLLEQGSIQLTGGETQTLTFPQHADKSLRLEVDQRPGHPGFSEPRADISEPCGGNITYTPSAVCGANGEFTFGITIDGTPRVYPTFTVVDQNGNPVDSGTVDQLPRTYTGKYQSLTMSFAGEEISAVTAENCYTEPTYVPEVICVENSNGSFVVNITGNGATPLAGQEPTYEVLGADGNILSNGALSVPYSQQFDGQTAVTVKVYVGGVQYASATRQDCYTEPTYVPEVICVENSNGSFMVNITGNGATPLTGQEPTYEVFGTNGVSLESGALTVPFSKQFDGQEIVQVVVYVGGVQYAQDTNDDCYTEPTYVPEVICVENSNGSFVVNITGNGATPLTGQEPTYEVLGADGNVLSNGALSVPYSQQFDGQTAVTVKVYVGGAEYASAARQDCYTPPVYNVNAQCVYGESLNGVFGFSYTQTGGTPITNTLPTYVITDGDGNEVARGSVSELPRQIIGAYGSLTITLELPQGAEGVLGNNATATAAECYNPPVLLTSAVCTDQNGQFRFTVTNVGGLLIDDVDLPSYTITDEQGVTVDSGVLNLPFDQTYTGEYNSLTMSFSGGDMGDIQAVSTPDCFTEPVYVPSVICTDNNGEFAYSITNTGGSIVDTLPSYELFIDGQSQGVVNLGANDLPVNGTVRGQYGNVELVVYAGQTEAARANNDDCYELPQYEINAQCNAQVYGSYYFAGGLVQGSAQPLGDEPTFVITDADGNEVRSGVLSDLPFEIYGEHESLTITLTTTEGTIVGEATQTVDCYDAPVYEASLICYEGNGGYFYSVSRTSGQPLSSAPVPTFEIVNTADSNEVILSGSLQHNQTIVSGPFATPVESLTLNLSLGTSVLATQTAECYEPPVYEVTGLCLEENGNFGFTVVNTGGEPIELELEYVITDQDGNDVERGSIDSLPFEKVVVGDYDSLTMTLIIPEGGEGSTSEPFTLENCYEPPAYVPEIACSGNDGAFRVTVNNVGGDPLPGSTLPNYTVVDNVTGNVVFSGAVDVLPFVADHVGPYDSVTMNLFLGSNVVIATDDASDCYGTEQPNLDVGGVCVEGVASFTITNNGNADMTSPSAWRLYDAETNQLLQSGTVTLNMGETTTLTFEQYARLNLRLEVDQASGETVITELPACERPVVICGETTFSDDGFPSVDMNPALCGPDEERPNDDWEPVLVGEAICPDWLAYHTDQTDDWEIFRLGELPDGLTGPLNLSRGVDAIDVAPSRSPDGLWIAFASTRDGNWEIYVSRVDDETGESLQRVTRNDTSIDLDPVWSPDGTKLAYESTVDGNWEIRLIDLVTGEKWRLTDHPANDINPFWSPDGNQLIFQSDREEINGTQTWQLFTIDLTNGYDNPVVTWIEGQPQGDNHDPQYSKDGQIISFRSYVDDSSRSAVYIMNADGTGVTRVSQLGGEARNHALSPNGELVAYQSNVFNGINDIYVYEIATGQTRLITENSTPETENIIDISPTWFCESTTLVFASNANAAPDNQFDFDIYSVEALQITDPPYLVATQANRMTTIDSNDRDPQNTPAEENASRNGALPPKWTQQQ